MFFDFSRLPTQTAYNLLTATVTPRPIAWVTTRASDGTANAAPFSFFNVMGHEPPTVALGLLRHVNGKLKDTATNIIETGQFAINLVSEELASKMNQTCADYAPHEDELAIAGLATTSATRIAAPLITDSPVSFECESLTSVMTGPMQFVVIGRVLAMHIRDTHVLDSNQGFIDTPALDLISRMHGGGWYARSSDLFQLSRPTVASK